MIKITGINIWNQQSKVNPGIFEDSKEIEFKGLKLLLLLLFPIIIIWFKIQYDYSIITVGDKNV